MNGTATSPAKPPPLLDGHEREPMVGPDAARNGGGGGGGDGLTPRGGPEFPNMQQTFLAPPPTPHVVVFYLLALCIGFIVPWHWFYLAWSLGRAVGPGGGGGGFALEAGRSSGAEAHLHTMRRAGRNDALTQAALYLASLALFFAFRMPMLPWVRDCPGGKGMSVSCLFQHQDRRYVFFYVMHVIFLVWTLVHFAWDLCAGWLYVARARRDEPMRVRRAPLFVTGITALICGAFLAANARSL